MLIVIGGEDETAFLLASALMADHTVHLVCPESSGGPAALVLMGADLVTGFSAALACVGNTGPGFGEVGPMGNYAHLPAASKLVLTLGMWVGRLEIVTVLALFHPDVWRNLRLLGRRPRG
jgi:Trk-type K+ transport system membrane component